MGRQDITDYLGLTIETVCRVLSDLKHCKLITTPNTPQAVLHDIGALRDICQNEAQDRRFGFVARFRGTGPSLP